MNSNREYTIQLALKKLKSTQIKIGIWALSFFAALLSGIVSPVIDYYIFKVPFLSIFSIPLFILGALFLLTYNLFSRIITKKWCLWVLENIHYLQDFVFIRKIAEKKGIVQLFEDWLSENYIIKKRKGVIRVSLLEKLEIFEYAFKKDYEKKLLQGFQYRVSAKKVKYVLRVILIFIIISMFFWLLILMRQIELQYFGVPFNIFMMIVMLYGRVLSKFPSYFKNKVILEVNPEGIKSSKFKNNTLIPWRYITKLRYKKVRYYLVKGQSRVPYIDVYLKSEKRSKEIIYINIDKLDTESMLIYKQMKAMYDRYLEEYQTIKNR